MSKRALALQCWLAVLLAFAPALRAQTEPPTAEAILRQMEATYTAARSYLDTTSVQFRNPDGSEGARVECKIWFSRPRFIRTMKKAHDLIAWFKKPPKLPMVKVVLANPSEVYVDSTLCPLYHRSSPVSRD